MLVQFTHPAADRWEDLDGTKHVREYRPGAVYDLAEAKANLWKNRGCAIDAPKNAVPTVEVPGKTVQVRFVMPVTGYGLDKVYDLPAAEAAMWIDRRCAVDPNAKVEGEKDAAGAKPKGKAKAA